MPNRRDVKLSRRAEKALLALDSHLRERVKEAIQEVAANPLLGKNLKGEFVGLRSYRLGPLRIVYQFTKDLLEVVFVDYRKDVYR